MQRIALGVEEISEIEAEGREGFEGGGQQSFAAGFVDGRLSGVDDFDVETLSGGCDGGSDAGGACPNDENIPLRRESAR